jgi:hypothetical protein
MYLGQSLLAGSEINVMALIFGFTAALVCVYEAIRIWRDKIL